jgi:type II secretory pathway pseudopilin PulG
MRNLIKNKSGQVWVETVIYTLIGLSVIGILLAVATPKIADMKDNLRINEAIDILNQMDSKISEVQSAPGNQRYYGLTINKGKVILNGSSNEIVWVIETNLRYSEPGITIYPTSDFKVLTEGDGFYRVYLTKEYPNVNFRIDGDDTKVLELESSTNEYPITINSITSGSNLFVDLSVS